MQLLHVHPHLIFLRYSSSEEPSSKLDPMAFNITSLDLHITSSCPSNGTPALSMNSLAALIRHTRAPSGDLSQLSVSSKSCVPPNASSSERTSRRALEAARCRRVLFAPSFWWRAEGSMACAAPDGGDGDGVEFVLDGPVEREVRTPYRVRRDGAQFRL